MKKTIIAIAFALVSLSLGAKDIVTNKATGATLNETAGIYSIGGLESGIIAIGDAKTTAKVLTAMDICFAKEGIEKVLDKEIAKEYEVGKDKDGWYVVKIGFGAVKLRPSDVNLFLGAIGYNKISEGISKGAGELKKLMK